MTIPPIDSAPVDSTQSDRQQQAKLVDGARQFEAMLLGEMLKPLHFGEAAGADDVDGDSSGGANDTLRSMGVEALTKSLASGQGFGLAKQIIQQVNREDHLKKIKS